MLLHNEPWLMELKTLNVNYLGAKTRRKFGVRKYTMPHFLNNLKICVLKVQIIHLILSTSNYL